MLNERHKVPYKLSCGFILSMIFSGFANFIDEWSQCDFLLHKFWSHFRIFGVKYQTFQHTVLACIHYREGYMK